MTPITKIEDVVLIRKGDRLTVHTIGNDWASKLGIEELSGLTYFMFTVTDIPAPEMNDIKNHIFKLHLTSHEGIPDVQVKASDLLDGNWHLGA